MTNNRPLRVFLCHSSNDKPFVRELYNQLILRGIDAWLDEKKLLPGQQWMLEIPKAVREADAVIICLSKSSITKEGYVQREIKFALDIALEKPEGTIYLIPAKIEECEVPYSLREWQWVNIFEPNGLDLLYKSLQLRADSLGLSTVATTTTSISDTIFVGPPKEKKESVNPSQNPRRSVEPSKNITLSNGMEFMCVPAGDFIMGCSSNQEEREKPQHTVEIPYDYWMARFPVTNMLYSLYTAAHKIKHPIEGWENKKNHPVAKIKWMDAAAYCQWLNELFGREIPSELVMRLPTEAEWEKAARGTDGREYPWGNRFDGSKCNTSSNELTSLFSIIKGGTTPVNKYSPRGDSPYGCADMAGNIWEWTHSLMDEYPYQPDDGREDGESPGSRVLRGGSFFDNQWYARCAYRHEYTLDFYLYSHIGFRVAIAPPVE